MVTGVNSNKNTHSDSTENIEERVAKLMKLAAEAGKVIREAEKRENPNELRNPAK